MFTVSVIPNPSAVIDKKYFDWVHWDSILLHQNFGSFTSPVSIMKRIQAGKLRNQGLIPA
jgi:hypothetical protein